MRFEKIWVEQCRATRGIRRQFGAKSALDYLIGEKVIRFAEAAEHIRSLRRGFPGFWRRSGGHSMNTSWPVMSPQRNRPSGCNCGGCCICAEFAQLFQIRKCFARNQKPNGSSLPRNPLNKAVHLHCKNHLMNRGRAHLKISLHIGLSGRAAIDLAVVVNEGKILTLFISKGFCGHGRSLSSFDGC